MKRARVRHGKHWLALVLLALVSVAGISPSVQAAGRTPRGGLDTVALISTNGSTFTYGEGTQPSLAATVTFGTPATLDYFWEIRVQVDGVTSSAFNGIDSSSMNAADTTLTFAKITSQNPLTSGTHTLTVTFNNPGTGTTVQSNGVSITITKATADLGCAINNSGAGPIPTGQSIQIAMQNTHNANLPVPVDWQDGTYSVTIDGPTHLSYSNLKPDANDVVTVMGPTKNGLYTLGCTFSGTALFKPGDPWKSGRPYTFSAMHSLGTVQLYSNPTTLVAQKPFTFYLVFHAAPGLPVPTGEFSIVIGSYFTRPIAMASSGANLLNLTSLGSLNGITKIGIHYFGDVQYADTILTFPLTNPAIPAGASGGGTGSGAPGARPTPTAVRTPTPTGTATPKGTATASATPTAGASTLGATTTPPSGSGGAPWLLVVLALLILAGSGVGAMVLRARQAASALGAASLQAGGPRGDSYGASNEDTWPLERDGD